MNEIKVGQYWQAINSEIVEVIGDDGISTLYCWDIQVLVGTGPNPQRRYTVNSDGRQVMNEINKYDLDILMSREEFPEYYL